MIDPDVYKSLLVSPTLVGLPDDALNAVLACCDLSSVAGVARSCRQLSTFIKTPKRSNIMWKSHLCRFLSIPPCKDYDNVEIKYDDDEHDAKLLLRKALNCRPIFLCSDQILELQRRNIRINDEYLWRQYRPNISSETIGWNTFRIEMRATDAHFNNDYIAIYTLGVPRGSTTAVRRRFDNRTIIDVQTSSISYFEINLVERQPQLQQFLGSTPPCVAIGLSTYEFNVRGRQPGWTVNSLGYHSDDGKLYHGSGSYGFDYGPTFGAQDAIGCGIHIPTGSVFFTKNGTLIGTAFVVSTINDIKLHPIIGLDSKAFSITVNFGTDVPFQFDVEKAEQLYKSFPPPARQSARLAGTDRTDDTRRLDLLNISCKYREAINFHPWNTHGYTRVIDVVDSDFGYHSYEDSSYEGADDVISMTEIDVEDESFSDSLNDNDIYESNSDNGSYTGVGQINIRNGDADTQTS